MSSGILLTLLVLFASLALFTGVVTSSLLSSVAPERRRLRAATREPRRVGLPETVTLSAMERSGFWHGVGKLMPRSAKDMERLRKRLARAGIEHPSAPVLYTLGEYVLPLVVGAIPLMYLKPPLAFIVAGGAAILTFFAPSLLVERRLASRRREIEDGLPDALDLLVVCIEAGSGLDSAIVKTAEELSLPYPALAEELRILTTEVRAGKPRLEAFKSLAQRTKVDDVRALVAMLVQTDRFGTSVGQALRTHADTSRTKRRQRAEEQAQKLGVKLVFPLVLFFFPALYVVILGPAIIQFMHQFYNK